MYCKSRADVFLTQPVVVLAAALFSSLLFGEQCFAQESSVDELVTTFILSANDPSTRCYVLTELGKKWRADSRTLPLLVASLTNESADIRLAAAQGLREFGKDVELAHQSIAMRLDDKDDRVGQECALCLVNLKEQAIDDLRVAQSVSGRIRAVWVLGEIAPEISKYKDRQNAVRAGKDPDTAAIRHRRMLSLLRSALKDEAVDLRIAAVRAAAKSEELCVEAWPDLAPRLEDVDAAVRRQAVLAFDCLCSAPPSKTRDEAMKLSRRKIEALSQNDPSEAVRSLALEVLKKGAM